MDDCDAEDTAASAFENAWEEIEKKVKSGLVEWRGQKEFVVFVCNWFINRCRDKLRRRWREAERIISIDAPADEGEEGQNLPDRLGIVSDDSPEKKMLGKEAEKAAVESVHKIVRLLAAAQEICRNRRARLEILKGIEEYVRKRIAATLQDGADAEELTWGELLEMSDLEELMIDKTEMNQFLMERLRINRNTLDQRMRATRDTLKKLLEAENG
jgi:DNA-directed RNA polymerase specialized sigma24 family protein